MTPELKEALIAFREVIPQAWFALYQGSLAAGFDKYQSFCLVQTHILSQNPFGIRPPSEQGPPSNDPE